MLGMRARRAARTFEVITIEYEEFSPGDRVRARPGTWWDRKVHTVTEFIHPETAGAEPLIRLEGGEARHDARHFELATED